MTDRYSLALSATLTVLFAAPLAAAQTAPAPTPVPAQTPAKKPIDPRLDDQAIVCKRVEATGTRLGGAKECHTRAEWSGRSAIAHEQADRMINTPQVR